MTETFSVPDYDAYPVVRALGGARIVDGDVEVRWDDGSASALPGCGCASSARTSAPFTR